MLRASGATAHRGEPQTRRERLQLLERPQERVPGRRAASAPTTCAWTRPSRASGWPTSCSRSSRWRTKYGLRCANVFHAGDGNLHPLILFDANDPDQLHRCELFGADILETSVAMGGTVTGEHGVGVEKLNSMCVQFSADEREQMLGVKRAFDPQRPAEPGQGDPDAAALRRVRQDARAAGAAAVSRAAAVLMQTCKSTTPRCSADRPRPPRARARRAARIRGGGTRTSTASRRSGERSTSRRCAASRATSRASSSSRRAAARRSPSSRRRWPSSGQCLPFEPPRFGAAQRRRGRHRRRHGRGRARRAGARRGRRRARLRARRHAAQRPRRGADASAAR